MSIVAVRERLARGELAQEAGVGGEPEDHRVVERLDEGAAGGLAVVPAAMTFPSIGSYDVLTTCPELERVVARRAPAPASCTAWRARPAAGTRRTGPRRRRAPRSRGRAARRRPGRRRAARPAATRSCSLDQVDAGDQLGHRVLDLEPGVHLEEVERRRSRRRAGTRRCRRSCSRRPRASRTAASCIRSRTSSSRPGAGASSITFWWRRWTEHSRVAEVDHVAVGVAEHLDLDVAAALDVLLEQHGVVAERRRRLALRRRDALVELGGGPDDAHALAAAAGGGLDEHREGRVGRHRSAPRERPPRRRSRGPRPCGPSARSPRASGPIQVMPASVTARAKPAFSERKP